MVTWEKQHPRRDTNPAHLSAFAKIMDTVHQEFWTNLYTENFRLGLLCTLPEFRFRGADQMGDRGGG